MRFGVLTDKACFVPATAFALNDAATCAGDRRFRGDMAFYRAPPLRQAITPSRPILHSTHSLTSPITGHWAPGPTSALAPWLSLSPFTLQHRSVLTLHFAVRRTRSGSSAYWCADGSSFTERRHGLHILRAVTVCGLLGDRHFAAFIYFRPPLDVCLTAHRGAFPARTTPTTHLFLPLPRTLRRTTIYGHCWRAAGRRHSRSMASRIQACAIRWLWFQHALFTCGPRLEHSTLRVGISRAHLRRGTAVLDATEKKKKKHLRRRIPPLYHARWLPTATYLRYLCCTVGSCILHLARFLFYPAFGPRDGLTPPRDNAGRCGSLIRASTINIILTLRIIPILRFAPHYGWGWKTPRHLRCPWLTCSAYTRACHLCRCALHPHARHARRTAFLRLHFPTALWAPRRLCVRCDFLQHAPAGPLNIAGSAINDGTGVKVRWFTAHHKRWRRRAATLCS